MSQTLREKLKKKAADLKSKQQSGNLIFIKADTTIRVRILFMGDEEEFIKEITQFYLGSEIKGVISPVSIDEPCAIMESYLELKGSDDKDENELASKFPPRNRALAFVILYKDEKGKEVNTELSEKFLLLTPGLYQDILELYLDEDEWGDMTDWKKGYDLKISRVGSGKTDTEYTVNPCKPTPTPKDYQKTYNLDKELKKIIPSYERTKELLNQYLGLSDDEDDDQPKKKVVKKKIIKKKPRNSDLAE